MRVRPGTIADRDFILGLAPRFAEFALPPWRRQDEVADGTRAQLDLALSQVNDRSVFAVCEDDEGVPLGFTWSYLVQDFYTGADIAKLSEIAVAQNGTGAATLLVEAFEAWARKLGCRLAILNVMEGNEHARAFYEGRGYGAEHTMMTKDLWG